MIFRNSIILCDMKKYIFAVVAIAGLLSVYSCKKFFEEDVYVINVDNRSDDYMYSIYRLDGEYKKQSTLKIDSLRYNVMGVKANSSIRFIGVESNPEECLSPQDTISIFLVHQADFEGKTWKQLVASPRFTQVYHLSGDDIRRLKSNVPFPPTEGMCEMDIVPACGN